MTQGETKRPSLQERVESLKQQYQQFSQREDQAQAELLHARSQKLRIEGAVAILNEMSQEICEDEEGNKDARAADV